MRRIWLAVVIALLAGSRAARSQIEQIQVWDGPVDFSGPMPVRFRGSRPVTDAQLVQQVREALQGSRDNVQAWRQTVEDRLVSLGPQALPILRAELNARQGYEFDALLVSGFRLENVPINPREALTQWGRARAGLPANLTAGESPTTINASHILIGGGELELFPHHLFYIVECPARSARWVVALAADAKVQELADDPALLKFIRAEAQPQPSAVGRERVSTLVALLAAARVATIYKPETIETESRNLTSRTTIAAAGVRQTATVSFDKAGIVQSLATTGERTAAQAPTPVVAPTTTATPPPPPPIGW